MNWDDAAIGQERILLTDVFCIQNGFLWSRQWSMSLGCLWYVCFKNITIIVHLAGNIGYQRLW